MVSPIPHPPPLLSWQGASSATRSARAWWWSVCYSGGIGGLYAAQNPGVALQVETRLDADRVLGRDHGDAGELGAVATLPGKSV